MPPRDGHALGGERTLVCMVHEICDGRCDARVPSCPACDAHPMDGAGRWWVCAWCGVVLLPRVGDPVQPCAWVSSRRPEA